MCTELAINYKLQLSRLRKPRCKVIIRNTGWVSDPEVWRHRYTFYRKTDLRKRVDSTWSSFIHPPRRVLFEKDFFFPRKLRKIRQSGLGIQKNSRFPPAWRWSAFVFCLQFRSKNEQIQTGGQITVCARMC